MMSPSDADLYSFTSRLLCILTFAPYVSLEVKPACDGVRGHSFLLCSLQRQLPTGWIPPVIQGPTQLTALVSGGIVEVLHFESLLEFLFLHIKQLSNVHYMLSSRE